MTSYQPIQSLFLLTHCSLYSSLVDTDERLAKKSREENAKAIANEEEKVHRAHATARQFKGTDPPGIHHSYITPICFWECRYSNSSSQYSSSPTNVSYYPLSLPSYNTLAIQYADGQARRKKMVEDKLLDFEEDRLLHGLEGDVGSRFLKVCRETISKYEAEGKPTYPLHVALAYKEPVRFSRFSLPLSPTLTNC